MNDEAAVCKEKLTDGEKRRGLTALAMAGRGFAEKISCEKGAGKRIKSCITMKKVSYFAESAYGARSVWGTRRAGNYEFDSKKDVDICGNPDYNKSTNVRFDENPAMISVNSR